MKDEIIKVEYKEPEFSEGAVEMAGALIAAGLTGEELLMLPRACGDDVDAWKGFIKFRIETRAWIRDAFDGWELITKENLASVCQTLREKGLIKEFSESFKTVNYFLANFPKAMNVIHQSTVIDPNPDCKTLPDYWFYKGTTKGWQWQNQAIMYNVLYDRRIKGIPEYYNSAVRGFLEELLPNPQYTEIIDDIYGAPSKYCGFTTFRDSESLKAAKETVEPFVEDIVSILVMPLKKRNLL